MSKKYPHLKLPKELVGRDRSYTPITSPFWTTLNHDIPAQKQRIVNEIQQVKEHYTKKKGNLIFGSDKNISEIKVEFYDNSPFKFIDRYAVDVYSYSNQILVGNISNHKLPREHQSLFEKFEIEIENYAQDNSLKTIFKNIKDIFPLSEEILIDEPLKDSLENGKEIIIDINFEGEKDLIEQKFKLLNERYGDEFLTSVNTDLVHFCRLKANKEKVDYITSSLSGISRVSPSPYYDYITSSAVNDISTIQEIIEPTADTNPILLFDTAVNKDHICIGDALLASHPITSVDREHGTSVASLIINGPGISKTGKLVKKNNIISIDVINSGKHIEKRVEEMIPYYHERYPLIIANISINQYGNLLYDRTNIPNFTLLLDEFSNKYNCLFIVSAGNLFMRTSPITWTDQYTSDCITEGYPKYFKLPYTGILPPSDSINSLCVGSVSKGHTTESIAHTNNPSPISRRNITENISKKPDLLEYDGNYALNESGEFELEDVGPLLADANNNNGVIRGIGTSFTAPLVSYTAGVLHNAYKDYTNNTIKALLIHFAEEPSADQISEPDLRKSLLGYGIPNLEKALSSFNTSATIIIENEIGLNKQKTIKFPVPQCLKGSSQKRLKLKKTIVYNTLINKRVPEKYNPILITAGFKKGGITSTGSFSTQGKGSNAFEGSNVKKYNIECFSTSKYFDNMWELTVKCECNKEFMKIVDEDYKQKFSIILTIEDIQQDDSLDIYEDISLQIENEIANIIEANA